MALYDYRNTDPKGYVDLAVALAGSTPGTGGVPYANTNPKPYIDAEIVAAGGSVGSGYANTSPKAYLDAAILTLTPADPPDTTPPNTTITQAPATTTPDNTPTFVFSSSESPSTFEVKMDAGAWEPATGTSKTYATLADGSHTFQVRAIDAAGNVDPSPASHTFTVETTTLPPSGMALSWTGDDVGVGGASGDWNAKLIENAVGASIENGTYGGSAGAIRINMPTPSSASGDRVEMNKTGLSASGEFYFQWDFYIPSSVTIDPRDSDGYVTINQFHGNNNPGYTGGFGITEDEEVHVRVEGGLRLDSNNYEYEEQLVVGSFNRDTWHTIGYHVKWDMSYLSESPTGFAVAYLDGTEGARVEGVPTMGDKAGGTDAVMFRIGWYPQYVGATGLEMFCRNVEIWS